MAGEIRKRKTEFNELAHSIKQFETHKELQGKMGSVEQEIKDLE